MHLVYLHYNRLQVNAKFLLILVKRLDVYVFCLVTHNYKGQGANCEI